MTLPGRLVRGVPTVLATEAVIPGGMIPVRHLHASRQTTGRAGIVVC